MREIELSYEVDEKDQTVLTSNTTLAYPGLFNWRITGKLLQSFTTSEIDDTLFALVGDTTAKAVVVRATSAVIGASNPEFTGTGYLIRYNPFAGGVGDLHETDIEIAAASDLARAIA
jgi:hypothetical protein